MEIAPSPQPGVTPANPKRASWTRWLLLVLMAGTVLAFFALGWHREFTWENLQARRGELADLLAEHPILFPAIFFLAYVAMAALS